MQDEAAQVVVAEQHAVVRQVGGKWLDAECGFGPEIRVEHALPRVVG